MKRFPLHTTSRPSKSLKLSAVFLLCSFIFCGIATNAFAQNFESLGLNPLSNDEYQCVRFANSNLNTILTIDADSGAQKNLSIKSAKKKLSRAIKSSRKRQAKLRRQLKKLQKAKTKLQSKFPIQIEKVEKLNEKIEKFDGLIARTKSGEEVMKFILSKVKDCDKDIQVFGHLQIFTNVYELHGEARFNTALLYVVESRPAPTNIQAKVTGHSVPLDGGGGIYYQPAPSVSSLSVRTNYCLTMVNDDCLMSLDGHYVVFSTFGGREAPGTCGSREYLCSVSAAQDILGNHAQGVTVEVVDASQHTEGAHH